MSNENGRGNIVPGLIFFGIGDANREQPLDPELVEVVDANAEAFRAFIASRYHGLVTEFCEQQKQAGNKAA